MKQICIGSAALVVSLAFSAALSAAEPDLATGIQKGLAYLTAEGVRWKTERKCASCHHVPQMIWALSEARQRGYAIEEAALADAIQWTLADPAAKVFGATTPAEGEGASAAAPPTVDITVLMTALAIEKLPADDIVKAARLRAVESILARQRPDGSWAAPAGRPPLRDEPTSATALTLWALRSTASAADGVAKTAALAKGEAWLGQAALPDTNQALALRLILAARTSGPPSFVDSLSVELVRRQNADGGWSQTADMPSDAFATGQALYALRAAGLSHDDDSMKKGAAFLLAAQATDGSWPMTSRPIPPATAGAGDLNPIRYAGSSWGVLGLLAAGTP